MNTKPKLAVLYDAKSVAERDRRGGPVREKDGVLDFEVRFSHLRRKAKDRGYRIEGQYYEGGVKGELGRGPQLQAAKSLVALPWPPPVATS